MQATTRQKSFIEVLEDEIRADLRRELEAEMLARSAASQVPSAAVHAAGRLETWLASNVGPITFKTQRSPYGATRPRTSGSGTASTSASTSASSSNVASLSSSRQQASNQTSKFYSATSSAEIFALELLNRQSSSQLSTTFTEDQLKTVWRKAALKTHPDRFASSDQITQMRMTVLFRELAAAYETLSSLIESKAA